MGKIIKGFVLSALFLTLANTGTIQAEDASPGPSEAAGLADELPAEYQIPGRIESTGIYFEVKDSEYLNVTLASSELIKVALESAPEMVTMRIESAAGAASTQITLGGLAPQTTYHKYEDNYHNHVAFTTDDNGRYTYTQDLSAPHLIFIQPRSSTKFIRDDATGGDCYSMGLWDSPTKTCTLTMDLYETIQIDSNNIILDGNGRTITGTGTGAGVYLSGRTGVTVKNLNIRSFYYGIYLHSSNGNILTGNTVSSNWFGVYLRYSSGNTLTGNSMYSNASNFLLVGDKDSDFDNSIDTTNTVSGKPIYYIKNAANAVYGSSTNAGTFYCIWCNNITIKDLNLAGGNSSGIFLWETNNSRIENSYDGGAGITLHYSSNNILIGNTASSNWVGIYLGSSSGNTLTDNTARIIWLNYSSNNILTNNTANSNSYYGIRLDSSSGNILTGNTANSNGWYGIFLNGSSSNTLTNNTATGNRFAGIVLSGSSNTLTGNTASSNRGLGIFLNGSSNTLIGNTVSSNGRHGIELWNSSGGTLTGNTANSNNYYGIYLWDIWSSNNTLTNNTASYNRTGIRLETSSGNTLTGNTVSSNSSFGIFLGRRGYHPACSNDNMVYNNNFINNSTQAYLECGSGNVFSLDAPIGGNYWSNYDTPAEGCSDANGDGFCDAPYVFTGGQDNLPWTKQDGWKSSDSIAPATTIALSGTPGNNGWYLSDVQATLAAADNEGGSGVAKTEYSFDGTTWVTYTASFTVGTEGITTVYYRSADNNGNMEAAKSQTIKIDKTAPVITITSPTASQYDHSAVININFTTVDELSGVYKTAVYLDGQPYDPTRPLELLYLPLGIHTLTVESENHAGLAATQTVDFEIIATAGSTTASVEILYQSGAIESGGVATSLTQQLEATQALINTSQMAAAQNILEAFINMLEAQSGHQISTLAADILKADALYMIGEL